MLEQASGECWNPSLQVICSLAKAVLLPLLSRVRCATPHSRVWAGRKDSLIPVFPLFSLGLTEALVSLLFHPMQRIKKLAHMFAFQASFLNT